MFLHTVLSDEELDNKVLLASYLNYISAGNAKNIRDAINSSGADDIDDGTSWRLSDLEAWRRVICRPNAGSRTGAFSAGSTTSVHIGHLSPLKPRTGKKSFMLCTTPILSLRRKTNFAKTHNKEMNFTEMARKFGVPNKENRGNRPNIL